MPVPQVIADAPELQIGLDLFHMAYMDLTTCRVSGGAIPWNAMKEYCMYNGYDDELTDEVIYIVRHVDVAVREWHEARAKQPQSK